MTGRCFRFVTLMLALLCGSLAHAQQPQHIQATLEAESRTPTAGGTVTVAFVMRADKGWHGYWKNPGDAGMETQATWTLPAGVAAGPLAYPVPRTLLVSDIMNYVYEGRYAQLVTLTLPPGLAPGTALPIRVRLDWLACTEEICVPESAELATDLTVGDGAVDEAARARFDRYRAAMPRPLGSAARFEQAGGRFRLAVPLPAAVSVNEAYFFPLTEGALDYGAPQVASRSGDMLILETAAGDAAVDRVEGVLRLGDEQGLTLTATKGTVPAAGTPLAAAANDRGEGQALTILAALGGAILGGLLLNIMPCVFPILSLKALSLAKAGGDERTVRVEALSYTAGVVLVCVALGLAILALRAAGTQVGWAFQLTDPRIILVLLLLTAAIGFNLAGLFELPMLTGGSALAGRGGAAGAFWTGALAAFVATPCTGPFMGVALGTALILPVPAAVAVFAGLGLGLALPFLLLGFVPALRRRLPRPGPWMDRLRRILALPMFATALALAWILGRQAGSDGMALGLAAALLMVLGLWWVGRRQAHGAGHAWWPLAPALAAALALIPVVSRAPAEAQPAATAEAFSEARLATLRAAGPVFVYFTADWCVTCKVNERAAIDRAEVRDAFNKGGIAVLAGDWTRGDPVITRFLARHDRSGVPLYLFYRPGQDAPEILPQVLTPGRLTALVQKS